MSKLKLFGAEVLELTKDIPSEPLPKPIKKKKGTITISYGTWGVDIPESNMIKGNRMVSVDFNGHNEGSGSAFNTEEEAQEEVERIKADKSDYNIKIIDERDKKEVYTAAFLNNWKAFIVDFCKEKGQEIDKIWFDKSTPYDCEINVRMKGHRCWYNCVAFRFQSNRLKAYDSHFGNGTSFIDNWNMTKEIREQKERQDIKEILEKVFNKECSNKEWATLLKKDGENGERLDNDEHKEINVDEQGWYKDALKN